MGAPALAIRQGVLPENTAGSHSSLALRLICLSSALAHTELAQFIVAVSPPFVALSQSKPAVQVPWGWEDLL
jgi:hypothetical protein